MDSDPRESARDLQTSAEGEPTLYFDIVNELDEKGKVPETFTFCYANEGIAGHVPAATYEITLKAEGGGTAVVRRFRIRKGWSPTNLYESITMEPL